MAAIASGAEMIDKTLADYVLAQCVRNDQCMLWPRAKSAAGYGQLRRSNKLHYTHRIVAAAYLGMVDGAVVMHICDVPACCNPDHLMIGTQAQNMADKCAKGRQPSTSNERSGKVKLSNSDVAEIRARHAAGDTCRSIAAMFHVHEAHVSRIIRHLRRPHE